MSIDYFMDRLELWEVYEIFDASEYLNMPFFESARIIAFMTAQVNSRKKLNMQDILKLPIDTTEEEREEQKMTAERLEDMKARADLIAKTLKDT